MMKLINELVQSFPLSCRIIDILKANRIDCYVFGKFIRDWLFNKKPTECSLITTHSFVKLAELLKEYKDEFTVSDSRLGVIYIIPNTGSEFTGLVKIYQTCIELKYPEKDKTSTFIPAVSLKDDADHRPFTLDSIYYNPVNNKIYDFYNGLEDAANKLLKPIKFYNNKYSSYLKQATVNPDLILRTNAWSIEYDLLLDFAISEVHSEYGKDLAKQLTTSTIKQNFLKCLTPIGIENLTYDKCLEVICPELDKTVEYVLNSEPGNNKERELTKDQIWMFTYIIDVLDQVCKQVKNPPLELKLAALFHCISVPVFGYNINTPEESASMAKDVLERLEIGKSTIYRTLFLIRHYKTVLYWYKLYSPSDKVLACKQFMKESILTNKNNNEIDYSEINLENILNLVKAMHTVRGDRVDLTNSFKWCYDHYKSRLKESPLITKYFLLANYEIPNEQNVENIVDHCLVQQACGLINNRLGAERYLAKTLGLKEKISSHSGADMEKLMPKAGIFGGSML